MLSIAKSSSTCPTKVFSGSTITSYEALSGIAPALVRAASRAPRRALQASVDHVAVDVRPSAAFTRRGSFREHLHGLGVALSRQVAVRVRPPHEVEKLVLAAVPLRRTRRRSAGRERPAAIRVLSERQGRRDGTPARAPYSR